MRRAALILLAVLIAACSKGSASDVASDSAPAPNPAPPQEQASPAKASPAPTIGHEGAALFPANDLPVAFTVRDRFAQQVVRVEEHLLRDGERLAAVADGKVYAVWQIRPDGVWRLDPHNPTTSLRYLPATLADGLYWRQRSGDADVWFRLQERTECSHNVPSCWELVVLNRGERTVFRFLRGIGPIHASADNWAEPARSFEKHKEDRPPAGPLSGAERQRLLGSVAAPPDPAPVAEVSAEQFEEAVYQALKAAQPALQVLRVDLNGDGRRDLVRARFGEWSESPAEFYQADGTYVGEPRHLSGAWRIEEVRFQGMRRPAFLQQARIDRGLTVVGILTARGNPDMNRWSMVGTFGWAPKSQGTPGDRVHWTDDGTITVEWDLGDPARHTRTTVYKWYEDQAQNWSGVRRASVTYRPEGKELVRPTTPQGVLQAAFVAHWLGFSDELPRYFATPEAAAAFAAEVRITKPDYGPGTTALGNVTPPKARETCGANVAQVEPAGPGPHGFGATWGGYEWCDGVWGTVTFSLDTPGRPLIRAIKLEGGTGHTL